MEARPITKTEQLNSLQSVNTTRNTGDASGNYVFIRAHDNNVQDIIAENQERNQSKSDGFTITDAEMKKAFEIYNKDMLSRHKNIP